MIDTNLLYQPSPTTQVSQWGYKTQIDGLYYVDNKMHPDDRGFFVELTLMPAVEELIQKEFQIKQFNLSASQQNVVRGFHAESWNKLVSVVAGEALCVLVDVRPGSTTFLQKEYFLLGKNPDKNLTGCLFIPSGLGNSICVLQGPVYYLYAVDQLYSQRDTSGDQAISLFDPDIQAQWPYERQEMIISDRDAQGKNLRHIYPEKFS